MNAVCSNSHLYAIGYADASDAAVAADHATARNRRHRAGTRRRRQPRRQSEFRGFPPALLASFNAPNTSWDQGNFNYGLTTNFGDFLLLSANFNDSTSLDNADLGAMNSFAAGLQRCSLTAQRRRHRIHGRPRAGRTFDAPACGGSAPLIVLADESLDLSDRSQDPLRMEDSPDEDRHLDARRIAAPPGIHPTRAAYRSRSYCLIGRIRSRGVSAGGTDLSGPRPRHRRRSSSQIDRQPIAPPLARQDNPEMVGRLFARSPTNRATTSRWLAGFFPTQRR